jgi:hypothetical protein
MRYVERMGGMRSANKCLVGNTYKEDTTLESWA